MISNEEFQKYILENRVNRYGNIDLNNLEFPNHRVCISGLKADRIHNDSQEAWAINNNDQKARVIYNDYQKANKIYNYCQKAERIFNNHQKADEIYTKHPDDY